MPTYAYACTQCPHRFDAVQSFSDDALTTCPQCQGRLRKVFNSVGVVFKGSGFYRTDSRSGGSTGESGGSADSSASTGASGSSEGSASSDSASSSGSSASGASSSSSKPAAKKESTSSPAASTTTS